MRALRPDCTRRPCRAFGLGPQFGDAGAGFGRCSAASGVRPFLTGIKVMGHRVSVHEECRVNCVDAMNTLTAKL